MKEPEFIILTGFEYKAALDTQCKKEFRSFPGALIPSYLIIAAALPGKYYLIIVNNYYELV